MKKDDYYKDKLTPEQYRITRLKETEPAFSGEYNKYSETGVYACVCCGKELFSSDAKYNSGSGWPSFFDMIADGVLLEKEDHTHGMSRTEIICAECNAHLGHVFHDGPDPTGLRYCVNSLSLQFKKVSD